jgi:tetratricopeptide (TPR) repeat protein
VLTFKLIQHPVDPPAAPSANPVVVQAAPLPMLPPREFHQPPPLPELPALPASTGKSVAQPRGYMLSASGMRLALPLAGKQKGLSKAFFEKGLRALAAHKEDVALDSFSRSTLDAPKDAESWYGVAMVSYELAKDAEALTAAEEALKWAPAHPMAHLLAAYLEQRAGRLDKAREHYQAYLAAPAPGYAFEVKAVLAQLPAP